jgi:hypothetical protein
MNIDLLPFSAFVLESSGTAGQAARDAQTLTLPLELVPVHAAFEPAMNGTVSVVLAASEVAESLHAAIVPVRGAALTITF